MAENQDQYKSEAPTLRRREESRQQGQVAFSHELNSGVLLLAGALVIWFGGRGMGSRLRENMQFFLGGYYADYGRSGIQVLLATAMGRGAELLGVLLATAFFVGLGVSVAQAGFYLAPEALALKWERLSPFEGWKRVVSVAGAVRGGLALLKVALIALLVLWVMWGRFPQIASMAEGTLGQSVEQTWDIAVRLLLAIAAALVLVGIADYAFQRYRYEQTLRMTRQELKEELKRDEGDPHVRARRRSLAREQAAKERMIQEVPRATVVITNPEHLAVALQYERGLTAAPRVLAKGSDDLARRIVDVARRHSVPVVERRPVAQALYKAVKVGEEIPAVLYFAVSEVLAYVYRLRGEPPEMAP